MNQDIDVRKLRRPLQKSQASVRKRQPLDVAEAVINPPPQLVAAPAELAAALRVARANGDFLAVIALARAILQGRDARSDPWAEVLDALLQAAGERLPPVGQARDVRAVHLDSRVEEFFEQMLSLIHQQNIQIAELWRIAADFV